MEKKQSNLKWNQRNNGNRNNNGKLFGLCLVGITAFSTLFAMGQVKQAKREQNRMIEEKTIMEEQSGQDTENFVPQVDQAIQDALEQAGAVLPETDSEQAAEAEELQAAASSDVEARMEEGSDISVESEMILSDQEESEPETDLAGEAQMQNEDEAVNTAENQKMTGSKAMAGGAELEDTAELAEGQKLEDAQAASALPAAAFSESDTLNWPVVGKVVLDYSMDGSVYFPTLDQYKYNPALIIGSERGAVVTAAASGVVTGIATDNETGVTITMDLGGGYSLKYGQLQDLNVVEGDVVNRGDLLGYVAEPTKYYCTEGSNLYFAMTKDGEPVDPVLYLE